MIISVVQSEMLSSVEGIGFLLVPHRSLFNVGPVYLGIILVLIASALMVNLAVSTLERYLGARPLRCKRSRRTCTSLVLRRPHRGISKHGDPHDASQRKGSILLQVTSIGI